MIVKKNIIHALIDRLTFTARRYIFGSMIVNFTCKDTEQLFMNGLNRRFSTIARPALRRLNILNAAISPDELRVPPGNRLEALLGDRAGQHSIRINDRWRICFVWKDGHAHDVAIVDYH